jgi:hypothetical protein
MKTPWIELIQSADQSDFATFGSSNFQWQALFASQIQVLDHQSWARLRWGFNAEALFTEAMERQKLFLETQHATKDELIIENPDTRTLAFRYINLPGEGLLLTVLGKISGPSKNEAEKFAHEYHDEITAVFPYDYTLAPATTREEFHRITGQEILRGNTRKLSIAQIKRNEVPIISKDKTHILQGVWHSKGRAHEQIWRSLAAREYPVLINTTIRPTVVYEKDIEFLLKHDDKLREPDITPTNDRISEAHKEWDENFIKRRIPPWKKYFYVQVHIASQGQIDDNLVRSVGATLTLASDDKPSEKLAEKSSLGFQVVFSSPEKTAEWSQKIHNLEIIFSGSQVPAPRLSEVADLEEVFSVARIPYSPPDLGQPIVKFLPGKRE